MLGAVYILLKLTGSNGLIGLVFMMQLAMYSESTSIVEDFSGISSGDVDISILKWWWFATAIMLTSGRCARSIALVSFSHITAPDHIICARPHAGNSSRNSHPSVWIK
jgi:hypothetical protein